MQNRREEKFYQMYRYYIISRCWYGIFMGFSDIVPGYSGGTTLNLLNFYEGLIYRIKLVFKKNTWKNWFKNILWLLPFVKFWMLSLLFFSYVTEIISINGYDVFLMILFFSFSLLCAPLFLYEQFKRKEIKFYKKDEQTNKKHKIHNYLIFILMVIGFLIFLAIAIVVFFNGGITFEENSSISIKVDNNKWIPLIIVAFFAGFLMLIPGISGQLIFFLTNLYDDFSWIILRHIFDNLLIAILMAISAIIGLLLSIFLINFCIKKIKTYFISFCSGFVLGSPIAILFGMLGNSQYLNKLNNLQNDSNMIIAIVFAIVIAIIFNILLFLFFYLNNFNIKNINKNNTVFIFYKNRNNLKYEKTNKFLLTRFVYRNHISCIYVDDLNKIENISLFNNIYCCFKNEQIINELQKQINDNQKIYWIKKWWYKI